MSNQNVLKAYLHGAFHDGTINRMHNTYRFCQKEFAWLESLKGMLVEIGCKSWIYKEGKDRNVYILETTASFLKNKIVPTDLETLEEKIAYIRGYFDSEGGIPQTSASWLYIQFTQKNEIELKQLKIILEEVGISCGKVHNPSRLVDSSYFRFFISRKSHRDFMRIVSSWHPRKSALISDRMKI